MGAARLVARGTEIEVVEPGREVTPKTDDALLRDARAMGIDPQCLLDSGHAAIREDVFILLPENVRPLDLFIGLQSQWRWVASGMGAPMRTGLDYAGVRAALEIDGMAGAELASAFSDIRLMEGAAMRAFAEEAARNVQH